MTLASGNPPSPPVGARQLADHIARCDECRNSPPSLERITASLQRSQVTVDAAAWSARTLVRLRPLLERRVTARMWRRVAAGVLLALLPLPAVLAYNAYLLLLVYDVVRTLLPATLAAYLVLSEAALLVLLFATTYAVIPILLVRGRLPALVTLE